MKRIFIILLAVLFLAACTAMPEPEAPEPETVESPSPEPVETPEPEAERLRVITSIFPQYDFVRQIAGDRVELSMLLSLGAEAHAFEPTPRDIIDLNEADLFIYVGGHSEEWLEPLLASIEQPDLRLVSLLDVVEHHHDHDHDHDHHDHDHDYDQDDDDHDHDHDHHHHDDHDHHDHDHHDHDHHDHDHHHHDHHDHDHHHHDHHDHDHHHHDDEDEHLWTSPRRVILIVQELTEILAELDPANADYFRENAAGYLVELLALDRAFTEVVVEGVRQTVIFGDRFPFGAFTHDYGLTAYAAFPGCSAETQASPATIAYLIEKVETEGIPVVFYMEFSTRLIANVIAEATGVELRMLHSVHNLSHEDYEAGVTYLDLMWQNLEHLREALS